MSLQGVPQREVPRLSGFVRRFGGVSAKAKDLDLLDDEHQKTRDILERRRKDKIKDKEKGWDIYRGVRKDALGIIDKIALIDYYVW